MALPRAPRQFTATNTGHLAILLQWWVVPNATGYHVYVGTDPDSLSLAATLVGKTQNSITLRATNWTNYWAAVAAYNSNGEGEQTATVKCLAAVTNTVPDDWTGV